MYSCRDCPTSAPDRLFPILTDCSLSNLLLRSSTAELFVLPSMYSVANLRAKVFCFLLSIEQSGRVHRVGYCDPCSPFAGLFIRSDPNNYQSVLVHLVSHPCVLLLEGLLYAAFVDVDPFSAVCFLSASTKIWVRSSTSGIRRDRVSISRFSFSHLHNCSSSSLIRSSYLRVSSSIIICEPWVGTSRYRK
jgi:hypothetical protein